MVRVEFEFFNGKEVSRIYIAGSLGEARRVEEVLTERNIDYSVEVEPFERYILGLFPSRHAGATFYVPAGQADHCRQMLFETGLRVGIIDED